jgi:hypothetical protein
MLFSCSAPYILTMMAMRKSTHGALYSAAMQSESATTNQSPRVLTLPQSIWPATSPAPFLVQPAPLAVKLPAKPAYKRIWTAMETTGSLIWVFACAAVSIVWVLAHRLQQKIVPRNRV